MSLCSASTAACAAVRLVLGSRVADRLDFQAIVAKQDARIDSLEKKLTDLAHDHAECQKANSELLTQIAGARSQIDNSNARIAELERQAGG